MEEYRSPSDEECSSQESWDDRAEFNLDNESDSYIVLDQGEEGECEGQYCATPVLSLCAVFCWSYCNFFARL